MKKNKIAAAFPAILIAGIGLIIFSCSDIGDEVTAPIPPGVPAVASWQEVSPIFQPNCASSCHGGSGGLYLDTYNNALNTGNHHPNVIIPFNPDSSLLYQAINGEGAVGLMPPGGFLFQDQIDMIENWIENGALENPPEG